MKLSRREFMKRAAITGAGVALLPRMAFPFSQSPAGIKKFVTGLPGLGPTGANELGNYISVLSPNTRAYKGTDYYEIDTKQFTQTIYSQPGLTLTPKLWGYADKATGISTYLGGVIVGQSNRPAKLKVYNSLPAAHILPVDPTAMNPNIVPTGRNDRIAVHLHGGLVRWDSDGGPFAWYSNPANGGFVHGASFSNGASPSGAAIYDYPNGQSARLLWYHDHAYGITRLNAYAGRTGSP